MHEPDLLERARAWMSEDPDPGDRSELDRLIRSAESGDPAGLSELAAAFSSAVPFGTAGMRAPMGAGPSRLNLAVAMRAAAGIARFLHDERSGTPGLVVVGYDARFRSEELARGAARVLAGAGHRVLLLPRALPTPVLAFATRSLAADAGVMVTASHNPASDNGLKVYRAPGMQIVPPDDGVISGYIAAIESVSSLPLGTWELLGDDTVGAYVAAVVDLVADAAPRGVTIAHTALHGVGGAVFLQAAEQAGFTRVHSCPTQFEPDPAFPTVPFPNPEEPGAMAAVLALADRIGADVALAHDPDADRCAVAVPSRNADGFVQLTGDEVGCLLGWWAVERARRGWAAPVSGSYATTIVSSSLLGQIAADAGLPFYVTLTGFKWLARVPQLAFGYEEALGYCVDPRTVSDKDGISAALRVCELVAALVADGRSVHDVLDALAGRYGVHVTQQRSVRFADAGAVPTVMAQLRGEPPTAFGDVRVTVSTDLRDGGEGLAATDALRFELEGGAMTARVIVRPSGTEPKLKCYVEVIAPPHADVERMRAEAEELAGQITDAAASLLSQASTSDRMSE